MARGFIVAFGMSWDRGPRFYFEVCPDPEPVEDIERPGPGAFDRISYGYVLEEGDLEDAPVMGFAPRKENDGNS